MLHDCKWERRIGRVLVAGSYAVRVSGTPGGQSMQAQTADTARRQAILDLVALVPAYIETLERVALELPESELREHVAGLVAVSRRDV